MEITRFRTHIALLVVPLVAAMTTACGLDSQAPPPLIGPSGLGSSVTLTASPDQLPRDGSSQSILTVTSRDPENRPMAGQRMTVVVIGGTASQDSVTTNSDGRATFAVTAPAQSVIVPGNQIVVSVTPVGQNADNALPRRVSIALMGVSNSTAPAPAFTVTPQNPEINQVATFDATTTTDEGAQCLDNCSYSWNFDDGTTATGRVVTHSFTVARAYNVELTVTDAAGLVVAMRQLVTPSMPAEPTVTLNVAPNPPVVNQQATFNAVGTAATNHQIVRYEWNFGDGSNTTTVGGNVTHTYTARGIYSATVRAVDDLGRAGSTSLQLNLTTGVPTGINATFYFTPTNSSGAAFVNATTSFHAENSTPSNGATIQTYRWDWGDGASPEETSEPIIAHTFTTANRRYVVQLTIVDSQGRTALTRQNVDVVP
jgi:PKD repeat protein